MKHVLENTNHRPWPIPNEAWTLRMTWYDLLFMHWPISKDLLRSMLPKGLELDCFNGEAWIGVIPFRMSDARPRYAPAIPWVSDFPELNVRTYVTAEGKPGVWFFSLDAASRIAVHLARLTYKLPYYHATMSIQEDKGAFLYKSQRKRVDEEPANFIVNYRPTGSFYQSTQGDIEHWLTERYCLYTSDKKGRIWRGDIHHLPWPLQSAVADVQINTMTRPLGLDIFRMKPILHFAHALDVVAWPLKRLL